MIKHTNEKSKVFLILLILIFNFQSFLKADDIKDFQIEGMSIGDSFIGVQN